MIGGRRLQLPDTVNMFPTVSSLRRTFICVDALDECVPNHRLEVLDSLGQILRGSPSTRMFMTGRSHIWSAVERGLDGRGTSVSIKLRDDDIVTYLRARLRKDTTPEVMDSKLEDDIMKRIPGDLSKSYVVAWDLGSLFMLYTDTHANLDSYWYRSGSKTILGGMTIEGRRNRLNGMGDGLELEDAYEAALEPIRTQEEAESKNLLWLP